MWKFLQTDHDAVIPNTWRRFLTQHQVTANKRKGPYSLFKDTSKEWYQWRSELATVSLDISVAEKECSSAMKMLGYLPMTTTENVKNLSKPVLGEMDCNFMNCWSYKY